MVKLDGIYYTKAHMTKRKTDDKAQKAFKIQEKSNIYAAILRAIIFLNE